LATLARLAALAAAKLLLAEEDVALGLRLKRKSNMSVWIGRWAKTA